jgi:hypothetical protein
LAVKACERSSSLVKPKKPLFPAFCYGGGLDRKEWLLRLERALL